LELVEKREKPGRSARAHDPELFTELACELLRQVHAAVTVDEGKEHHDVGPFDSGPQAFGAPSSDVPTMVFEPMARPPGEQGELGFVAFDSPDDGDVHPTLPVMEPSHDVRVAA
jgi:hypothetical protein